MFAAIRLYLSAILTLYYFHPKWRPDDGNVSTSETSVNFFHTKGATFHKTVIFKIKLAKQVSMKTCNFSLYWILVAVWKTTWRTGKISPRATRTVSSIFLQRSDTATSITRPPADWTPSTLRCCTSCLITRRDTFSVSQRIRMVLGKGVSPQKISDYRNRRNEDSHHSFHYSLSSLLLKLP